MLEKQKQTKNHSCGHALDFLQGGVVFDDLGQKARAFGTNAIDAQADQEEKDKKVRKGAKKKR